MKIPFVHDQLRCEAEGRRFLLVEQPTLSAEPPDRIVAQVWRHREGRQLQNPPVGRRSRCLGRQPVVQRQRLSLRTNCPQLTPDSPTRVSVTMRHDRLMAQRVTVLLEDDLDGAAADETLSFSLDGSSHEIDLTAGHAEQLRSELLPWIGPARKLVVVDPAVGRCRPADLRAPIRNNSTRSDSGPTATATR